METCVENYSFSLLTLPKNVQYIIIFIASLSCLALKSYSFRYYLKHVVYVASMNFIAILMIPVFMFRPRNVMNLVWVKMICFLKFICWSCSNDNEYFMLFIKHQPETNSGENTVKFVVKCFNYITTI